MLLDGEFIVGLPAVAFAYRRHGANATEVYTESLTRFEEECALLDRLAAEGRRRDWPSLTRTAALRCVSTAKTSVV